MKAHKLSGMVFEDVEGLDLEYMHIKTRKKGCISDQYMISYTFLSPTFEIYTFLLNEIKEGKIALKPNKGACDYCIYHRICHFKGLQGLNDEAISNIDINVGIQYLHWNNVYKGNANPPIKTLQKLARSFNKK